VSTKAHIGGLPEVGDDACYRAMDWLIDAAPEHKRLRSHKKAIVAWQRVTSQYPRLFAHWAWVHTPWRTG